MIAFTKLTLDPLSIVRLMIIFMLSASILIFACASRTLLLRLMFNYVIYATDNLIYII
jgi:hypothetical protein